MTDVFVDTSALYAILDAEDPNHEHATNAFANLARSQSAFTHNYVHVEADQLVRRRLGAAAARRLFDELLPAIETIWVEEAVHNEAIAAIAGKGRGGSLVDEVSFLVMRKAGAESALAYDADFERAGFRSPETPRHGLSELAAPDLSASREADLVSVSELAARSGRSVNTIQSWRRRHTDFPAPSAELAAGPIWVWANVSAWIDRRASRTAAGPGR